MELPHSEQCLKNPHTSDAVKRGRRVHSDGFAWVKYGEKRLHPSGMVREYYKCGNWRKIHYACPAKKVIDRQCHTVAPGETHSAESSADARGVTAEKRPALPEVQEREAAKRVRAQGVPTTVLEQPDPMPWLDPNNKPLRNSPSGFADAHKTALAPDRQLSPGLPIELEEDWFTQGGGHMPCLHSITEPCLEGGPTQKGHLEAPISYAPSSGALPEPPTPTSAGKGFPPHKASQSPQEPLKALQPLCQIGTFGCLSGSKCAVKAAPLRVSKSSSDSEVGVATLRAPDSVCTGETGLKTHRCTSPHSLALMQPTSSSALHANREGSHSSRQPSGERAPLMGETCCFEAAHGVANEKDTHAESSHVDLASLVLLCSTLGIEVKDVQDALMQPSQREVEAHGCCTHQTQRTITRTDSSSTPRLFRSHSAAPSVFQTVSLEGQDSGKRSADQALLGLLGLQLHKQWRSPGYRGTTADHDCTEQGSFQGLTPQGSCHLERARTAPAQRGMVGFQRQFDLLKTPVSQPATWSTIDNTPSSPRLHGSFGNEGKAMERMANSSSAQPPQHGMLEKSGSPHALLTGLPSEALLFLLSCAMGGSTMREDVRDGQYPSRPLDTVGEGSGDSVACGQLQDFLSSLALLLHSR